MYQNFPLSFSWKFRLLKLPFCNKYELMEIIVEESDGILLYDVVFE